MFETLDWKTLTAIVAVIVGNGAFFPYLWDVVKKKTTPHIYTWLIWALTQGTATAALWYGGAGVAAFTLTISMVFVVIIFFLSFWYGTKNITRGDTFILIASLLAIVVWWQFDQPVLAVLMVSAIDAIGYIPTYRKAFDEPWSETVWTWGFLSVGNILAILALLEYNLLTVTYLATLTVSNLTLLVLCLVRRQKISKPL